MLLLLQLANSFIVSLLHEAVGSLLHLEGTSLQVFRVSTVAVAVAADSTLKFPGYGYSRLLFLGHGALPPFKVSSS